MRLTTSTNYATPAMEITHVVSSDSLDLPHVVMQDDGSQDNWVAQQVVKGLTTSLVEKAQNGEDCTHLLQNLGNQLTPATLQVAVEHGALQAAVVARSSPDASPAFVERRRSGSFSLISPNGRSIM